MCRGSLRNLADSKNDPLMAPADWSGANEAEEVKESWPLTSIPLAISTLLAILGLAAHSPTLLMTPGYSVSTGGCGLPATIYYLSSPGLTAVYASGPARARSLIHSQAEAAKESWPLASILGLAAHNPTLLMIPC